MWSSEAELNQLQNGFLTLENFLECFQLLCDDERREKATLLNVLSFSHNRKLEGRNGPWSLDCPLHSWAGVTTDTRVHAEEGQEQEPRRMYVQRLNLAGWDIDANLADLGPWLACLRNLEHLELSDLRDREEPTASEELFAALAFLHESQGTRAKSSTSLPPREGFGDYEDFDNDGSEDESDEDSSAIEDNTDDEYVGAESSTVRSLSSVDMEQEAPEAFWSSPEEVEDEKQEQEADHPVEEVQQAGTSHLLAMRPVPTTPMSSRKALPASEQPLTQRQLEAINYFGSLSSSRDSLADTQWAHFQDRGPDIPHLTQQQLRAMNHRGNKKNWGASIQSPLTREQLEAIDHYGPGQEQRKENDRTAAAAAPEAVRYNHDDAVVCSVR